MVPVFVTFAHYLNRKEAITCYDFSDEYFSAYLRSYLAFRYQKPMFMRQNCDLRVLADFARDVSDSYALELYGHYERLRGYDDMAAAHRLAQWVINFPMGYAATQNMPTAIMVDEFQVLTDVYDPIQKVHHDLTDSFQRASETHWAPLLLHFSYRSLCRSDLADDRRLSVFRREPADRPVCGESGFSLLEALETVMQFELGDLNGKLFQHYDWEFRKYSDMLNSGQTTRKVMFWATKYPEEQIDAERVAEEIGSDVEEVQTALRKLQQADIVRRVSWTLYEGPGDPMLRRYSWISLPPGY